MQLTPGLCAGACPQPVRGASAPSPDFVARLGQRAECRQFHANPPPRSSAASSSWRSFHSLISSNNAQSRVFIDITSARSPIATGYLVCGAAANRMLSLHQSVRIIRGVSAANEVICHARHAAWELGRRDEGSCRRRVTVGGNGPHAQAEIGMVSVDLSGILDLK